MTRNPTAAKYSIAAVSKFTGISCHALRVWERRYAFPVPDRSPSGHRRYPWEQVESLKVVAEQIGAGRPISAIIDEIREVRSLSRPPPEGEDAADDAAGPSSHADRLLERLCAGDTEGGDTLFNELASRLDVAELITTVIAPMLTETGERFFRREGRVFEERCVTGFLRRKLEVLIEAARLANRSPTHRIVVGSVHGDQHEGGGLIVSLLLEHAGWRVINLGSDVAVEDYQAAVSRFRPDALGLSFILSRNINKRFLELSEIREIPVFVGGRSVLNYQGLARRHGLIPVVCSVVGLPSRMASEVRAWKSPVNA